MKLITLNAWGGKVGKPFFDFILQNKDIDIFCFQEVYDNAKEKLYIHHPDVNHDVFSEIEKMLPDHKAFFRSTVEGVYGIGIFVKNNINILTEGEMLIHKNTEHPNTSGHHTRNLQWIKIDVEEKIYTIINIHGLWNGMGKTDTPDRLAQSKRIREFIDSVDTPKIIGGDFNLRPDTESIKIIEKGLDNLIKTHGVTSTRTSLYKKPEKFADYIFTSPEIKVNKFEILPDEVSDHSPLFLDFN